MQKAGLWAQGLSWFRNGTVCTPQSSSYKKLKETILRWESYTLFLGIPWEGNLRGSPTSVYREGSYNFKSSSSQVIDTHHKTAYTKCHKFPGVGEEEPFPLQIGRTIWIASGSLYLGGISPSPWTLFHISNTTLLLWKPGLNINVCFLKEVEGKSTSWYPEYLISKMV